MLVNIYMFMVYRLKKKLLYVLILDVKKYVHILGIKMYVLFTYIRYKEICTSFQVSFKDT